VVVEAVRLFKRNATEREKRLDWLAERIGFEPAVEFSDAPSQASSDLKLRIMTAQKGRFGLNG
jgi:hypothetical protein